MHFDHITLIGVAAALAVAAVVVRLMAQEPRRARVHQHRPGIKPSEMSNQH
ncbi:hypothetical protein [Thioalkalivibrio sp. ALJT]|uniref:hypothetical protein n=1 Tax=Thioalkalivibrio sp. ALJT TaxID=1158146 RepID=UPI0003651ACB|nr:hypothetical protein [Thioalkalivibrio sp. ALJT]